MAPVEQGRASLGWLERRAQTSDGREADETRSGATGALARIEALGLEHVELRPR